jgi:hypothetical protein
MTVSRLYLCPTHGLVETYAPSTSLARGKRKTVAACPVAACGRPVHGPFEYVLLKDALDAARTIATDRGHPQPRRERDLIEGLIRRRARKRKDTPA